MALALDLYPGDALEIGGCVTVRVVSKTGRCARLTVQAPSGVPITRNPQEPETENKFGRFAPIMNKSGFREGSKPSR
jgi:sRNA-binding carbon storage regulator CsrA